MMNLGDLIFGKRKDPVHRAIEDAIERLEENDPLGAINVLREKALALNPGHRRARLHLGIALMLKGDLDEAEGELNAVAGPGKAWADSEGAAARIALERVAALRAGKA